MSDQNKTNLQTLGAGLLGFVAVVLVGGGFLLLHSKLTATSAARPAPAAAPIDLEAGSPRRAAPAVPFERREQSPAPLVGADEEGASAAPSEARARSASGASAQAVAASAAAASAARSAEEGEEGLEIRDRLTNKASTSAEARVKEAEKAKAPAKLVRKAAPAAGDGAAGGDAAVASVRYGVKSRTELMGRAAGPVYNVAGGAAKGGSTAGAGEVAPLGTKISEIKKQFENSNLPPEQRAALLKQLEQAGAVDVEAPPK